MMAQLAPMRVAPPILEQSTRSTPRRAQPVTALGSCGTLLAKASSETLSSRFASILATVLVASHYRPRNLALLTAAKAAKPRGVDLDTGVIREGMAEVLPNRQSDKHGTGADEVFYNPSQVFNRDISILAISVYAKMHAADAAKKQRKREQRAKETGRPATESPPPGLKVLEAFAATGIRSIRYAKEIEAIRSIVTNDCDETAVAHIQRNLVHNNIPDGQIQVTCQDALSHMYARRCCGRGGITFNEAYSVIDLDPYGTALPYLDAAVQAIADGGLLCITCTDMAVLCGNYPDTCFARYGGTPIKKVGYVHEMALRLVMHATSTAAAKYRREARPMVSVSMDFYVRLFVRIFDSPGKAQLQASKTGLVHQCVQCESFFVQPLGDASQAGAPRVMTPGSECPECGGCINIAGPFYMGPLFDRDFVDQCLKACDEPALLPGVTSWRKLKGLLTAISEEHSDLVFYYTLPKLFKPLKLKMPSLKTLRGTLAALGYRVSHFHREPQAIKTDAPNNVVYDLIRVWAEEHPPKSSNVAEVLRKEVSLTRPVEWLTEENISRRDKVPRFLPNPEPHWGPKARARASEVSTPSKLSAEAKFLAPEARESVGLSGRLKKALQMVGVWPARPRCRV